MNKRAHNSQLNMSEGKDRGVISVNISVNGTDRGCDLDILKKESSKTPQKTKKMTENNILHPKQDPSR